jgi:hypothetical protein
VDENHKVTLDGMTAENDKILAQDLQEQIKFESTKLETIYKAAL